RNHSRELHPWPRQKRTPGSTVFPGLQVVASARGPLVSGWLAVSGDGGQPSAWAHGVQGMGGFYNLKVVERRSLAPAQECGDLLGLSGAATCRRPMQF